MTISASPTRPPLLHSVQALRGIAALLVVLFHIVVFQVPTPDGQMRALLPGVPGLSLGWVGVDVFFVISGFVMVYIGANLSSGARASGTFIWRRAARIYPLWWIFAGLAALEIAVSGGGLDMAHVAKSMMLLPQETPIILDVGWTLIHEMYFYALFALALFLPPNKRFAALVGWAALILLANFVVPVPDTVTGAMSLVLSPLGLEFAMGALVGYLAIGGERREARAALLSGVALFAVCLMSPPALMTQDPMLGRILLFGLPTALILYGAAGMEAQGRLRVPSALRALGDWSYSLYLGHLFVLAAGGRVMVMLADILPAPLGGWLAFGTEFGMADMIFLIGGATGSILVAALTYRFVEQPLLALTKRRRFTKTAVPVSARTT